MRSNIPSLTIKEKWTAISGLLILLIITFAMGPLAQRLKTEYSISQFLPDSHPLIRNDTEARQRFFIDQVQPILLTMTLKEKSDWLETERLEKLEKASVELAQIPSVKRVLNLATVQGAVQSNDDLTVGRLLSLTSAEARRSRVLQDPLFSPLLLSQDARTTLIVLSTPEISNDVIRDVALKSQTVLSAAFPDAKVSIGGVPALQWQLTDLVSKEVLRFLGLALLATCGALLLVFRSISTAFIPFLIIFLSNAMVLGFMGAMGFHLTVLSITIPILVAVNVMSLAAHTMLRFAEFVDRMVFTSKSQALNYTLKNILLANFLTAMTTSVGFATLLVSNVPLIREYGVTVALAILLSWCCTSLFLYPLLLLFPMPRPRVWTQKGAAWSSWIFRWRKTVVFGVSSTALVFAAIGQNLHWTARLFDDLPEQQETRKTTEHIDAELGGMIPLEIIVEAEPDTWNDPGAVLKLDALLKEWRKTPGVGSAIGLPDFLRQAVSGETGFPASRKAIAESYFLLSMSEDSPLKQFLTPDGGSARVALRLRDLPAQEMTQLMKALVAQAQTVFPKFKVQTAGMATTVHELNNELSRNLLIGFWHALVVISVVLIFVFRSLRWTLVAAVPNLVPAAFLVGVLAMCETPIKPGVALVFSIALGIAFDNTIYLLCRLKDLMKEGEPGLPVEKMVYREGTPCLISSICLFIGFGIFLMSYFSINQTFGFYMLVSLTFGLVGDLFFMPAFLSWAPGLLRPKGSADLNKHDRGDANSQDSAGKDMKMPSISKTAAAILLLILPLSAHAEMSANDILQNVEKRLQSKDEFVQLKMKIIEGNGSAKERELEIKRKSGDKQQVLVRLLAPADVRGVALLSVFKDGSEDQWLYLPSAKKARRIVSSNRSQKFLDTEFSLEDFSASSYVRFQSKILREEKMDGAPVSVLESVTRSDESSYGRILTWVNTVSFQILKSEYYDKEGKLLKTMQFKNYKKFAKDTWRAQIVEVRNVQNKRATILKIAKIKMNVGLKDSEFSQSALE